MSRENYYRKAQRLLGEGRLEIHRLDPNRIVAVCRGDSGEKYDVGYGSAAWFCNCDARGRCSHLQALMLVVTRLMRKQ
jgi:hypothetical protein